MAWDAQLPWDRIRRGQPQMVEPAVGAGDLAPAGWPPMALALEGVARQGQALLGKGGMEGAPIDGQAAQMQLGQAGQDHAPVVLSGHQGGQEQGLLAWGWLAWALAWLAGAGAWGEGLLRQGDQAGPGAQVDKQAGPLGLEGGHPLGEPHRAKHLLTPIGRIGDLGPGQPTAEAADQGPGGRG